jgi:FkbM family methyltransferase
MANPMPFISVCEHTLYEPDIGPDTVVLDLGANCGNFSRTLSEHYGCTCHAVEASPFLHGKIEEGPRLRRYQYAVWSGLGEREFNISGNPESSSLFAPADGGTVQRLAVPTIDLESFVRQHALPKIDLLKVDVEGAEIVVFEATSDTLLSDIAQIAIEFHDFNGLVQPIQVESLKARLARLGFMMLKFSLWSHFDVLFLNRRLSSARSLKPWKLRLAPYHLKLLKLIGAPGRRISASVRR